MVDQQCHDQKDDSRFMTAWFYVNTNATEDGPNANLKRRIVDIFLRSDHITDKNRKNIRNMMNSLKDEDLKKELTDKIRNQEKSKYDIEQVEYFCNDEDDDSRFMSAWFYVNSSVKDDNTKKFLRRRIVDNFMRSSNTTKKNRDNVKNMVNSLKEEDLKNELIEKLQIQEKQNHNRELVDYQCNDEKDDSRFMTAWF